MSSAPPVRVRLLGLKDYESVWGGMREFTDTRDPDQADEFWLVQHPPVFTLGQAGREEHVLSPGDIPLVHSDRGGQVTYHGPGQLVLYTLINMRRLGIGVRALVASLEDAVIAVLSREGIAGVRREGAPGVYVGDAKVAALGLRVRRACSYHGVALNVDMDLEPFGRINPCGYEGLQVTSVRELGSSVPLEMAGQALVQRLALALGVELAVADVSESVGAVP